LRRAAARHICVRLALCFEGLVLRALEAGDLRGGFVPGAVHARAVAGAHGVVLGAHGDCMWVSYVRCPMECGGAGAAAAAVRPAAAAVP
ncbi:MAG: hypothetical protein J3K34DRAFT_260619, partial [Monoraphidium minutum]